MYIYGRWNSAIVSLGWASLRSCGPRGHATEKWRKGKETKMDGHDLDGYLRSDVCNRNDDVD